MRKPYVCDHESIELRRRPLPNSAGHHHANQCLNCGHAVGGWLKKLSIPNHDNLPAWDHAIEDRWRETERKYMLVYAKEVGVAAYSDGSTDKARQHYKQFQERYAEYLNSPAWKHKRALVMDRAHGLCEGCRTGRATQVHHLNYDRVGREMLFDLVAICDICHGEVHGTASELAF